MLPNVSSSLEVGFLEVKCETSLSNGVQKSPSGDHALSFPTPLRERFIPRKEKGEVSSGLVNDHTLRGSQPQMFRFFAIGGSTH